MRRFLALPLLLAAVWASAREGGEHRARDDRDEAADACWGGEEAWDLESPAFLEQTPAAPQEHWSNIQNTFGTGVEWLFRLMPGMRGKLYGRSLMPPCRCEACAWPMSRPARIS